MAFTGGSAGAIPNPFAVPPTTKPASFANPFAAVAQQPTQPSVFGAPSPFGAPSSQGRQKNAATTESDATPNPFGLDGAGDSKWAKRKRKTQFSDASDSESKKNARGSKKSNNSDGRKKKDQESESTGNRAGEISKWGQTNGNGKAQYALDVPKPNKANPFANHAGRVPSQIEHKNDTLYAKRIYDQLAKDGLSPPSWPSQPGDPRSKAEMASFREAYKTYRDRARISLIKAGLIDDPDKPKRLEDAIDFKGICEDMCPDFEKITRITEFDVKQAEKDPSTSWPNVDLMVKKLARSAAGQEAPLPMDVRSSAALKRSLDYLIDDLLQSDSNLPIYHGFLWDRTRAIRRDFVFHSTMTPQEMKEQVYCLETITRFHVTSLHLMAQQDFAPEDFEAQQEVEQLSKALLSLMFTYDDCKPQGIVCENEAEFRAYHLLFNANQPNILETVQREWDSRFWNESDEIRTAVSLVEALKSTQDFYGPMTRGPALAASSSYNTYFRIMEDPKVSYTMACFAEIHLGQLRRSILHTLKRALRRPKGIAKDVTPEVVNRFLRFDEVDDAVDFVFQHGLEFDHTSEPPTLNVSKLMEQPRLAHSFSYNLVEIKRGDHSLPEVLHGNLYEEPRNRDVAVDDDDEDKLFVDDGDQNKARGKHVRFAAPEGPILETTPFEVTPSPSPQLGSPAPSFPAPNAIIPTSANTTISPFSALSGPPPSWSAKPTTVVSTPATSIWFNGLSSMPTQTQEQATTTPQSFSFSSIAAAQASGSGTPATPFSSPFAKLATDSNSSPFQPVSSKPSVFAKPLQPLAQPPNSQPSLNSFPKTAFTPAAGAPAFGIPTFAAPAAAGLQPPPSAAATLATSGKPGGQADSKAPEIKVTPPTPNLPPPAALQPSSSVIGPNGRTATAPQAQAQAQSSILSQPMQPLPSFIAPAKELQGPSLASPSNLPALSEPSPSSGPNALTQPQPPSIFAKASPLPPLAPPPPVPKRDLLGDFAEWFVNGDGGLMDEFTIFMVRDIVTETFKAYEAEKKAEAEKVILETSMAEARAFRIRKLSEKYSRKWKENIKSIRASRLRRSEREKAREYHEKRRASERKRASTMAALERVSRRDWSFLGTQQQAASPESSASADNVEVFRDHLKRRKAKETADLQAQDALLSTGILAGISNEQAAVSRIIRETSPASDGTGPKSLAKKLRSGLSKSVARMRPDGAKMRALREEFGNSAVRWSLPPAGSALSRSPTPEKARRVPRVSSRWLLKARGLVTMPDGTALPEALADEMRYGGKRYPGLGSFGLPDAPAPSGRRMSTTDADYLSALAAAGHRRSQGSSGSVALLGVNGGSPNAKRKHSGEEERDGDGEEGPTPPNKRVASDPSVQKVLEDMRSLRKDLVEGMDWMREQREDWGSRGMTPASDWR